MRKLPEKLKAKLRKREQDGNLRRLYSPTDGVDFASNDYLGLVRNPPESLKKVSHDLPAGSTGSRLLSGNHRYFRQAETSIAKFHRAETSLIYNSGYDANIGLLSALAQRNDVVFSDQAAHASIRDGLILSGARTYSYAHNDLDALEKRADVVFRQGRPGDAEVYVVSESVFSMEGDGADVPALVEYCVRKGFRLILDEAHATGVLGPAGRGAVVASELEHSVFARLVTFGKALGCHGAAVLCSAELREYLLNFSRSLIYTTALPPHSVATIQSVYEFLETEEGAERLKALHANIRTFRVELERRGLDTHFAPASAAIFSFRAGSNDAARSCAAQLREAGYDLKPILSPTVPKGRECLRFCLHSFNTDAEIQGVLSILELQKKSLVS